MNGDRHWPEYAMEAALLGLFMVSACLFTVLLEHPLSPTRAALPDGFLRRALIGAAMGLTALALTYSPWGQRSGAHLNPAVTLAFFRLGKVERPDALAYVAAQCAGGILGVQVVHLALGMAIEHPSVAFAVTIPGSAGTATAFVAELAMSFGMMLVVLTVSNSRHARLTGVISGALVATYITLAAPLSGVSINPARTLASALGANVWTGFWVYVVAPIAGMLGAAEAFLRARGAHRVLCAKLQHEDLALRCIFRCCYGALERARAA